MLPSWRPVGRCGCRGESPGVPSILLLPPASVSVLSTCNLCDLQCSQRCLSACPGVALWPVIFLAPHPGSQPEGSVTVYSFWKLSTHCLRGSAPPCKYGNLVDEALVLIWFLLLFLNAWLLGAQPQVMRCLCLLKKSAFCVCM